MLKRFFKDESGQGMVEYGLIIAVIAVVVIGTLAILGTNIKGIFQDATDSLTPPATPPAA
ncbi:MAG: Flp family type IVb pilin [Clostridiales bacterium]|nr:MAG: Flp family type IVb pilin [Clostridiales bacterium]